MNNRPAKVRISKVRFKDRRYLGRHLICHVEEGHVCRPATFRKVLCIEAESAYIAWRRVAV